MNASGRRRVWRLGMVALGVTALIATAAAQTAAAQTAPTTQPQRRGFGPPVNPELTKESPTVLAAVRPLTQAVHRSVATVVVGGRQVALATAVREDGLLVTKASELPEDGPFELRLADNTTLPATRLAVINDHDLAVLKVDAALEPVTWADPASVRVGQMVVAAGTTPEPLGVGVVSVGRRPTTGGFLGVTLSQAEDGVRVEAVSPGLPAERAGIRPGDVIVGINDETFTEREELSRYLQLQQAGTEVSVTVRRGEELLVLRATLARRPAEQSPRSAMQNAMGSTLSSRRTDFPSILQHDTVLQSTEQGGPLLDLDGRVVGINIARAGRVETYALPVEVVRGLLDDVMAGKFQPVTSDDGRAGTDENGPAKVLDAVRQRLEDLRQQAEQLRQSADEARRQQDQARQALLRELDELTKQVQTLDAPDAVSVRQAIEQLRASVSAAGR
ncbi:MAG: PDZ domain-containing protein [Tepidisphaerales bacterium]